MLQNVSKYSYIIFSYFLQGVMKYVINQVILKKRVDIFVMFNIMLEKFVWLDVMARKSIFGYCLEVHYYGERYICNCITFRPSFRMF